MILNTAKLIVLLERLDGLYYSGRGNSDVYQCQSGLE